MEIHVPLSSKGQVTVPKEVREYLEVVPGERLVFKEENGSIFLEKHRGQIKCPVCEGKGTLSAQTEPCFICKEKGMLETDFSVLQSIPLWQRQYQLKTECNFRSDIGENPNFPEVIFHSDYYSEDALLRSQDCAFLYLFKELMSEDPGYLSMELYQQLQKKLSHPKSHFFLSMFDVREWSNWTT